MMYSRAKAWTLAAAVLALGAGIGCEDDVAGVFYPTSPYGTLRFLANGEDFARNEFKSKDNWDITFDHVYICVAGPTAIQIVENGGASPKLLTKHAGHSHVGIAGGLAHVSLGGEYIVDLAQGTGATEIGRATAKIGNYNRLSWSLKKATSQAKAVSPMTTAELEDVIGHCVVLVGTAFKSPDTVAFTLKFGEELFYLSTEANGNIGIVTKGGTGAAEMTFHFDHIFGDGVGGDPDLNAAALGFDPFKDIATDLGGNLFELAATFEQMKQLLSPAETLWLYRAYLTLGHTGEGHCMFIPGLPGGGEAEEEDPTVYTGTGTLEFQANGEDFARDGFKSMDGWDVTFSAVVVNISNPSAVAVTTEGATEVNVAEHFAIDLTQESGPIVYSLQETVPAGNYNRVTWAHHCIVPPSGVTPDTNVNVGDLEPYGGYSYVLEGSATSGSTVDFVIRTNDQLSYSAAGPHPDGIGAFNDGGTGAAEATFHFDHIFGDFDTLGEPDSVNDEALGFQPIADLDTGGGANLTIDVSSLANLTTSLATTGISGPDIFTFYKAFLTLGHCGEEHCFVALGHE